MIGKSKMQWIKQSKVKIRVGAFVSPDPVDGRTRFFMKPGDNKIPTLYQFVEVRRQRIDIDYCNLYVINGEKHRINSIGFNEWHEYYLCYCFGRGRWEEVNPSQINFYNNRMVNDNDDNTIPIAVRRLRSS